MKFVDDDDDDDDMPLCDVGLQNSHNKPNMRIKRLLCKWKFINADENGTVLNTTGLIRLSECSILMCKTRKIRGIFTKL